MEIPIVPLREILSKELTRRIKDLGIVRDEVVEPIVNSMASSPLDDTLSVMYDPAKLADRVRAARPCRHPSSEPSQYSRPTEPVTLVATPFATERGRMVEVVSKVEKIRRTVDNLKFFEAK